jgi:hypothetical protein
MPKNKEGLNGQLENENVSIFWDVTPCSLMGGFRRFGRNVNFQYSRDRNCEFGNTHEKVVVEKIISQW